jgi:L-lactate dehydrogenase complex protein LldF
MSIKTSELPLKERFDKELGNLPMREAISNGQDLLNAKREAAFEELGDYEQWRETAGTIRSHVLENLDYYLNQFTDRARAAGAHVYFAEDAAQATGFGLEILQNKKALKAVKSKSMVTEEIGLNELLEETGIEVIETDLGEYLLQIDDHDKPSHIVVPALHKNREHFRQVLAEKKGYTGDNVPENMTRFVRQLIRKDFLTADVGITGCNFGVAETGTVTLVTNEGNGRFVTTAPETQIVFMGMERIVPTFAELDIMFSVLARSAVGAKLTSYMSLITGPRGPEDKDGPEELHIIVVDNGRSKVLESEFREVLRCIRCGTCMMECPAFRHISGHGYGTLYPGPLGLALVPVLAGYDDYKEITKICSLCGGCNEVCPVKIPLYEFIFEHRRIIAEEGNLTGVGEKFLMGGYGNVIGNSALYNMATKATGLSRLAPKVGPLKQWSIDRELPEIPKARFRDWFAARKDKEGEQ